MTYKEIFLFSLPAILASMLEPIAGLVDTAFVGQISTTWLAALGASVAIFSSFGWIFNFLLHGTTASIGKEIAQGRLHEVQKHIWMGLLTSLILGLVAALVLLIIRDLLFQFMNIQGEVRTSAISYFNTRLFGFP